MRQLTVEGTAAVGAVFFRNNPDLQTLIELNKDANLATSFFAGSAKSLGTKGVKRLLQVLRDTGVEQETRLRVIRSFKPGSIRFIEESPTAETAYRWASKPKAAAESFSRYYTPDVFPDGSTARRFLDLPPSNTAAIVERYEIQKGAEYFTGVVSSSIGNQGGGTQIFMSADKVALPRQLRGPF